MGYIYSVYNLTLLLNFKLRDYLPLQIEQQTISCISNP